MALQSLRVAIQYHLSVTGDQARDQSMAENTVWIDERLGTLAARAHRDSFSIFAAATRAQRAVPGWAAHGRSAPSAACYDPDASYRYWSEPPTVLPSRYPERF